MTARWVVVDDTSLDINYVEDSWFSDVGSLDAVSDNGPPFLSTSHRTNTSASLAFNFIGSAVRILGTNYIRNVSGMPIDPQWLCYVDGVGIETSGAYPYPENNWRLCFLYHLRDGPHTITVNVTIAENQPFWFDRIEYLPSTSVSHANKTMLLESTDPAIRFGDGWVPFVELGNLTNTHGAKVECHFRGTSLIWYGTIPSEWNGSSTTATWAIDQDPPQTFVLNGHGDNATTKFYHKFFETPVYPFDSHTLTVTYNGDDSKTPLVLGNLVIQNNTVDHPTVSPAHSATHATPTTTIVGGVIGAVGSLLISVTLLVIYRRRKKKAMVDGSAPSHVITQLEVVQDPPSRLPAKALEGDLSPGHHPSPRGPLLANITESVAGTGDGQHSRNPRSDTVHRDSGAHFPQLMPEPPIDLPPEYTTN